MHGRPARFLLFATVIALFVAGPSFSDPRMAPAPGKSDESRMVAKPRIAPAPRPVPEPRVASAPGAAPEAPVAPESQVAPRPGQAPTSRFAPRPAKAPGPQAAPAPPLQPVAPAPMCGTASEISYVVPVGLAPVTNRNTCRGQGRTCCEETSGWCVAEGFYWQSCEDCFCGFQCMAPALFE